MISGIDPKPTISILSDIATVRPFVEKVRTSADQDKMALGFLPAAAYEEAANRGNLLVAKCGDAYAGHLLFGGSYPVLRVFQLYVVENFRRYGIGKQLIESLIRFATKHGYLSISASVAHDLPANRFWEKSGFVTVRTRPGGSSRNRCINVRIRELETPSLFRIYAPAPTPELGITPQFVTQLPVYVLDLNVFWDVVQCRPRKEFAAQVLGAAFENLIRVLVTQEFLNELERTRRSGGSDPALEFALQLPVLRLPPEDLLNQLVLDLAALIFPSRANSSALSVHDRSDLVHLATAVHHEAAGFVTSEEGLIKKRDRIYEVYGVDVIHVTDLASGLQSCRQRPRVLQTHLSGETVRIWNLMPSSSDRVKEFIQRTAPDAAAREEFTVSLGQQNQKSSIVTSDGDIICLASWEANAGLNNRVRLRVLAEQDHPAAEAALDCLLDRVTSDSSKIAPVVLTLTTRPGDSVVTNAALLHGFDRQSEDSQTQLNKVCVGKPVWSANWRRIAMSLERCSGLRFANELPHFASFDQEFKFADRSGRERSLPLNKLEKYLSPTLLILPGRPGVITPIQRAYADDLFGSSPQLSLLPLKEAVLFSERVYFSSSRNRSVMKPGTVLIFYESGKDDGRSAAIAVARVVATEIVEKKSISATLLRRGVVEASKIAELSSTEHIAVTKFDNVLILPTAVPLSTLRMLGCADGANLVTARTVSTDQTIAVMEVGFNDA